MRGLVYTCAILGMLLATGGIAEYDGLLQIHTLPHMADILIGDGAAFVLLGFLMFGVIVRRERRVRDTAESKDEVNEVAERLWRRY